MVENSDTTVPQPARIENKCNPLKLDFSQNINRPIICFEYHYGNTNAYSNEFQTRLSIWKSVRGNSYAWQFEALNYSKE